MGMGMEMVMGMEMEAEDLSATERRWTSTVLISFKIPHTLARVPSAILAAAFRSAVRGGEGVFWG